MAGAQSDGGKFDPKAASIFGPAGGSSTGGQEESAYGRGGGGGGGRGGGGIFAANESSGAPAGRGAPAPAAAPRQQPAPSQEDRRKSAMEDAMREQPKPDLKQLAPKSTGDAKDIKALLEQLQGAATSTADIVDINTLKTEVDNELPADAREDLQEMTRMLVKLDERSGQVSKPTAGKSFNQRLSVMENPEEACPDWDNDAERERDVRDTMKHIVKINKRESPSYQ